jgi:hypothetical protein
VNPVIIVGDNDDAVFMVFEVDMSAAAVRRRAEKFERAP